MDSERCLIFAWLGLVCNSGTGLACAKSVAAHPDYLHNHTLSLARYRLALLFLPSNPPLFWPIHLHTLLRRHLRHSHCLRVWSLVRYRVGWLGQVLGRQWNRRSAGDRGKPGSKSDQASVVDRCEAREREEVFCFLSGEVNGECMSTC
jgi:hypothetical protein